MYESCGLDAIIIENFGDAPFYPDRVPPATIAAMSAIVQAVGSETNIRIGVNVLRNDAESALAICNATRADFFRVNIHTGAALTDQGMIEGKAHETLRIRENLGKKVAILADIDVKHAAQLAARPIEELVAETASRGKADGLIITGAGTGLPINMRDLEAARAASSAPLFAGSGVTLDNMSGILPFVDGVIVGSAFKLDGNATNSVDESRVRNFMNAVKASV